MTRLFVLSTLLALGVCSMAWSQAAPPGAPAGLNPANFTGTVTARDTADLRVLRYTFEPGARSNWHSHAGGQVIVVEQGRMRGQERGGAALQFGPRQTYVVASGVVHWHGAEPNEPLTQVALSYGVTTWLDKVTDEQYAAAARR